MNLRASAVNLTKPDGSTEKGLAVLRREPPGTPERVAIVLDSNGDITVFGTGYRRMELTPEDGCFEVATKR